jgi:hypothetical protein
MRLIEAEMVDLLESSAPDKGLKPLVPHDPLTAKSGFQAI